MSTTRISAADPKDPGAKKSDVDLKKLDAEKIVNEQDQQKINNAQRNPETKETAEEAASPEIFENTNADLTEKVSDEPEHVTPETLEDERKQRAGINP